MKRGTSNPSRWVAWVVGSPSIVFCIHPQSVLHCLSCSMGHALHLLSSLQSNTFKLVFALLLLLWSKKKKENNCVQTINVHVKMDKVAKLALGIVKHT